jgi:hypothetical protein
MWGIEGKEGSISETLFKDQAGLITINTSDIHTSARTRLLTAMAEKMEWPLTLSNSNGGFDQGMDGFHGRKQGLMSSDV